MQPCDLRLQAPSNLAGSRIKNTHLFPLSQRYDRKYWEKHPPCWLPGGNAIKPVNSKLVEKYMLSQALSKLEIGMLAAGGILGLGVRLLPLSKRPAEFVAVMEKEV